MMQKAKLLKLATHLRDVVPTRPEHRFNLSIWSNEEFRNGKGCGTAACAFGEAVELFPDELRWKGVALNEALPVHIKTRKIGFRAAEEMFGLTREESEYLFNPVSYEVLDDPNLVADRIEELVRQCDEVEGQE